jgi:hypothetical protein
MAPARACVVQQEKRNDDRESWLAIADGLDPLGRYHARTAGVVGSDSYLKPKDRANRVLPKPPRGPCIIGHRMSFERRIIASRVNGAKPRGPVTPEGN